MPEFTVSADEAGTRLDALVAAHAAVSRALAARMIADGDVEVAGATATKSSRPPAGAVVVVREAHEAPGPAEETIDLPVVFEDDALIVIDKPAGMVVHPAPGHPSGTVVNALLVRGAAGGDDPDRPGIVHRLDVGTSGLMVVAKGEGPYRALVGALAERRVTRSYLALTEGVPEADTATIDAPIGRSPRHRKKMAVVAGGKEARTEMTVLERHARSALVEARPQTGRTHQIRVHLAAAGHPVAGDQAYGRDRALARALGLRRPFLHASGLTFDHPTTARPVRFEAPLPADLVEVLATARSDEGPS